LGKTLCTHWRRRDAHLQQHNQQLHPLLVRNWWRVEVLSNSTLRVQGSSRMGARSHRSAGGFRLWGGLHCSRRRFHKFSRRTVHWAYRQILTPKLFHSNVIENEGRWHPPERGAKKTAGVFFLRTRNDVTAFRMVALGFRRLLRFIATILHTL
jgi:hypothetical protein